MYPFSLRLEQQTLDKFHKWCKENNTTMSKELRGFIWSKVGEPKNVKRKKRGRKPGTKKSKARSKSENDFFDDWFDTDKELPNEMNFD